MPNVRTPDQFKTRRSRLLMSIIGLLLAYLLVSRALDTGSWWQYFGSFLLVFLAIRLIAGNIKSKK